MIFAPATRIPAVAVPVRQLALRERLMSTISGARIG